MPNHSVVHRYLQAACLSTLLLALGCGNALPVPNSTFRLGSQSSSLAVQIGGSGLSIQYLRVTNWDSVQGVLTNTALGMKPQTVTANAKVGVDGLSRSAVLTFSGISPASGYNLTITLLKADASGIAQPVGSIEKSNFSVAAGSSTIDVTGDPAGGIEPSIPPMTALGPYVSSIPGFGASARIHGTDVVSDGKGHYFLLDNGRLRFAYQDALGRWSLASIAGIDAGPQQSTGGFVDGPGLTARFQNPRRLAYDASTGAIYVADEGNNSIRKVTIDAKGAATVSTVAGNGTAGYQDGPGASALFNDPRGVAVDASGNVYVADALNNRIRKITFDSTGQATVSTLAGNGTSGFVDGPALQAEFKTPAILTIGADGRVYVGDTSNFRVRAIGPDSNGQMNVTTVAGSVRGFPGADGPGATATFSFIGAMTAGVDGNLYVSDDRIRKIVFDTTGQATVSTIAGGGTVAQGNSTGAQANFIGLGLCADASGLYVLESTDIRKITFDTSGQTEVSDFLGEYGSWSDASADGPAVYDRGFSPYGIAVASGLLYITDLQSSQIRTLDLQNPDAPTQAIAGDGTLGYQDGAGTTARFNQPAGIVAASDGSIFVADEENECIRKLVRDAQGNYTVSTVAGTPTIEGSQDGPGATAQFADPTGLAFGPDGCLYVADGDNCAIRKLSFDTAGQATVSTVAGVKGRQGYSDGPAAIARFNSPLGIVFDHDGNLLVADHWNACIRKITLAGPGPVMVSTLAGGNPSYADGPAASAGFDFLTYLAIDAKGTIYAGDNARVRTITVGPGGGLVVGTMSGSFPGFADGPGPSARFGAVQGLTVDGSGIVYVADQTNRFIRKIVP